MDNVILRHWSLPENELRSLIRRSGLASSLLRRQIEEEIVCLVEPELEPAEDAWDAFLKQQDIQEEDRDA